MPYTSDHKFTCKAQADLFKEHLETMADRPQDYVSARGRTTTNAVEGFHGLALMYRDKRTDLGSYHYMCKTNMSICHKVYTLYSELPPIKILVEAVNLSYFDAL